MSKKSSFTESLKREMCPGLDAIGRGRGPQGGALGGRDGVPAGDPDPPQVLGLNRKKPPAIFTQ